MQAYRYMYHVIHIYLNSLLFENPQMRLLRTLRWCLWYHSHYKTRYLRFRNYTWSLFHNRVFCRKEWSLRGELRLLLSHLLALKIISSSFRLKVKIVTHQYIYHVVRIYLNSPSSGHSQMKPLHTLGRCLKNHSHDKIRRLHFRNYTWSPFHTAVFRRTRGEPTRVYLKSKMTHYWHLFIDL